MKRPDKIDDGPNGGRLSTLLTRLREIHPTTSLEETGGGVLTIYVGDYDSGPLVMVGPFCHDDHTDTVEWEHICSGFYPSGADGTEGEDYTYGMAPGAIVAFVTDRLAAKGDA